MTIEPHVSDTAGPAFLRGGFWRRAFSFFFDLLVVCVCLEILAAIAYPLLGGHVQFSSGFTFRNCTQLTALPPGYVIPRGFAPNWARDCRLNVPVLGFKVARTLTVGRTTRDGAVTKTVQIVSMLDDEGHPISGFPLDVTILPLLLLYRWGSDFHGGSVGRRLTRTRLSSAFDLASPPARAINRRHVIFAIQWLPLFMIQLYLVFFANITIFDSLWSWVALVVIAIGSLASCITAIVSIARRRDAYYDRLAGTAVLRKSPRPGVTMANVPSATTQ